ncbi:glycosyltransferase family 2 protein [Rudaeicoccus suwonensis]|uniref:4,4'-diaponeurosporenoate glycosyltransferase n=1 Tax=Rudaeicoccus suwonensis TaxID=657409 RepID=A0A561EAK1_9MICO|nr:glycosyltransferase family 2 protein [Rudaeicoccus suwonensis]TWE12629.1 glycosyl transferase family 2 [Rudaeicoccus suwonensis]
MPEQPLVSVVVPTRNNRRTIRACLRSVREQSYPRIELIVIDNHSTDETFDVATELADIALSGGPERSAQRNLGIERATGEWVLWLDSDMMLPPDSVAVAVATATATGATGVALPERTIGSGFWTACRALERECYLNQPLLHNPRLVRREYLAGDGGFHLAMSGPEDADLRLRMRAAGEGIELAPIIVDHDEGRLTVRDVLSKRYYYGRSIPAFAGRHDGAVSTQGRAVLRAYVVNRRLLARDPAHAAGMVLLRSLEVVGYALGARRGQHDRRGERDV